MHNHSTTDAKTDHKGQRLAKVMSRSGLCSRRQAEQWIEDGRVHVNGQLISSPALNVLPSDHIEVDQKPLPRADISRLWLYHKKRGSVVSQKDEAGRTTIFDQLPAGMPHLMPVGRLDINTEGLLLLTNDGALKRQLELPENGWKRWYRVRAFGQVKPERLKNLSEGITIDRIHYGAIDVQFERQQGANIWLKMGLREGKNREIKKVLEHFGLKVNRLIRLSFGPFMLGKLAPGEMLEVKTKVLHEQLKRGANVEVVFKEQHEAPKLKSKPKPKSIKGTGKAALEKRKSNDLKGKAPYKQARKSNKAVPHSQHANKKAKKPNRK